MNEKIESENCLEYKEQFTLKDEDARLLIQKCAKVGILLELQAMQKMERDTLLKR